MLLSTFNASPDALQSSLLAGGIDGQKTGGKEADEHKAPLLLAFQVLQKELPANKDERSTTWLVLDFGKLGPVLAALAFRFP